MVFFGDLSLSLLCVCVINYRGCIEIEIQNKQPHREHRDRDLHGSDLDICPKAGIEKKIY